MNARKRTTQITSVGGNVFLDLGFKPTEATRLQAETKRIIAAKLAIKHELMADITKWMEHNHLDQREAAQILGVTRPRISDLICRKSSEFTMDALVGMLTRAGKQVKFVVR